MLRTLKPASVWYGLALATAVSAWGAGPAEDPCAQASPEEMARTLGVKLPPRPWHVANIWWDFEGPTPHFESLAMAVTIDRDVPAGYNLYIAPVGIAQINGLDFYGGLQTAINGWPNKESRERVYPGKGAIFSRWSADKKTPIGLHHVSPAGPDCLVESAGYEGEFASVRRPYAWSKGTYTYEIRKDQVEVEGGRTSTWFRCQVVDAQGSTQAVGRLLFEGADFTFWARHSAFVEVYSTARLPAPPIPKVNITFGWPRLNGRKPPVRKCSAFYPHTSGPAAPDCAVVTAAGEACVVQVGPLFTRDERERRHALAIRPL